jgi:hypothetical protein
MPFKNLISSATLKDGASYFKHLSNHADIARKAPAILSLTSVTFYETQELEHYYDLMESGVYSV